MQLKKFLTILMLLLLPISIAACNPQKEINIRATTTKISIPIQPRPQALNLHTNVKYYVVTENNLNSFVEEFKIKNGNLHTKKVNL